MKKLLIVGAGGFGREVACWAAEAMGRGTDWVPAGFLDDNVRALEGTGAGLPRVGGVSANGGKALNHFNKIHKGRLVAALVADSPHIADPESLVDWAGSRGLMLSVQRGTIQLRI